MTSFLLLLLTHEIHFNYQRPPTPTPFPTFFFFPRGNCVDSWSQTRGRGRQIPHGEIKLTNKSTMDSYQMQFFMLARIVEANNNESITMAVQEFEKLPKKDNYTELMDKANLPFLVDFNEAGELAASNESAKNLIREHRLLKSIKMNEEKQDIANNFYEALIAMYSKEEEIPERTLHLLLILLGVSDEVYIKLALRLLNDLDFTMEDYETAMDGVLALQDQFPEAEALIEKIQEMQRQMEIINELMEQEEGEGDDREIDDAQNQSFDDFEDIDEEDESFSSDDSGFDSDSEELFMEREEAERERARRLDNAIHEVSAKVLAESIRSGDQGLIVFGLATLKGVHLPLHILQKYEIVALILKHAVHCQQALELWVKISNLQKTGMANEEEQLFDFILEDIKGSSEVSDSMMDVLVSYLKN
ncbi:hypothetical protein CAEBREN_11433 [Caenorhabditis brenneri]|uniref:Uncharacterized protein n=1 Tax=Caenorhabditis brenneri TaxID=135651 RepID=G0P9N9_CAEBE|nr:hypothetical protein CAEBREN_11433 [Caenorhabditis brenneri]